MFEFLFLVTFAVVLFISGVSIIGLMIAFAAGMAMMAVAGMLGLAIKLLPWIILIAVVIWLFRERNGQQRYKEWKSRSRRY